MINIELDNIGKRFGTNWLFREINLQINQGDKIALVGHNGSGKSTLLQIISGFIRPTNGTVIYSYNGSAISSDNIYTYISYSAPYMELIEELTLMEFIDFYIKHQSLMDGITINRLIEISFLTESRDKAIRTFSSGMKQRLKLASALLSSTEIVLLDEPLSNLDANGVLFYKNLIAEYATNKTIVVCSNNIPDEIYYCNKNIKLG